MATDYAKYINSTGTHYISNSGSDENGAYHGGKAGDQTGKEWQLRSWYKRPWTCVLRHPDYAVRDMIAQMGIDAALNNLIGYDQYQRYTYWDALVAANYNPANIKAASEADCTSGVTANVKAVGHRMNVKALQNLPKTITSRNMRAQFKAAGFLVLTDAKYLTGYNYLLPGDILLYDNHHQGKVCQGHLRRFCCFFWLFAGRPYLKERHGWRRCEGTAKRSYPAGLLLRKLWRGRRLWRLYGDGRAQIPAGA